MTTNIPAPVIVQPSKQFDGTDGSWSSFFINVGTPSQSVRVLVSTAVTETWVILQDACVGKPSNCSSLRGGLFSPTLSQSWVDLNDHYLSAETNLGYTGNSDVGDYGYDTLGLYTPSTTYTLNHQPIAGIETTDFGVGMLGISPAPFSLNSSVGEGSFLNSLKASNMIPSLSWGYTAGASYRSNTTASLTLGGYDASRFVPNDIYFTFGNTVSMNLTAAIQTIQYTDSTTSGASLLPAPINALIDSTIPDIWLPVDACGAFEKAFGITWNPLKNYYFLNSTQHDALVKQNASVTFSLGNTDDGPSIDIVLPYASFDLQIGEPLQAYEEYYFPLRQALTANQYTLGRVFLQEAFLTVDFERGNFSVSQCVFPPPAEPSVVAIYSKGTPTGAGTGSSPSGTSTTSTTASPSASGAIASSGGISGGAIAGIVVAIIVIVALLVGGWLFRRRRRRQNLKTPELDGSNRYPVEMSSEKFRNSGITPPPKYFNYHRRAEVEGDAPKPLSQLPHMETPVGFMIDSGPVELGGQPRSEMESHEPRSPSGPTRHQTATSMDTTASTYPIQGDLASVTSASPLPSPEYERDAQFGHTPRDSAFQSPLILPQTHISTRHKAQNPSDGSSLVSPEAPSPGAQFPSPVNSPNPESHLMDPIHNHMNNMSNR